MQFRISTDSGTDSCHYFLLSRHALRLILQWSDVANTFQVGTNSDLSLARLRPIFLLKKFRHTVKKFRGKNNPWLKINPEIVERYEIF